MLKGLEIIKMKYKPFYEQCPWLWVFMISESYDIAGSHFQKIYKAAK